MNEIRYEEYAGRYRNPKGHLVRIRLYEAASSHRFRATVETFFAFGDGTLKSIQKHYSAEELPALIKRRKLVKEEQQ